MAGGRFTRRGFLGLAGGVTVATAAGGVLAGMSMYGETSGELLRSRAALPDPFRVPLPISPTAQPLRRVDGVDHYEMVQRAAGVEILPGLRTTVWGYDGIFPGPTIVGRSERPIVVTVRNELPVPTSTHLHGGVTPPDSDGYPTDIVVPQGWHAPGGANGTSGHSSMHVPASAWKLSTLSKDYTYPLKQRAATLWYHDHRMDFSGPQVWRGLAGFFLVRDDEESALPLPDGERDVPLLICDRSFDEDGSFRYPSADSSLMGEPGVEESYMEGVMGDVILVNGAPWPEMEVSATRYRFRLLNASNARRYRLSLDPGGPLTQIGSDAGLLSAPVQLNAVTLAPAERCDVVIDFSQWPVGSTVTLVNTLGEGGTRNVMRFVIARKAADSSRVPERLVDLQQLKSSQVTTTRKFDFRLSPNGHAWTVNGHRFDPEQYLATPRLGSVERWRFTSDFHHPVHLHLAHFQVEARNGKKPGPADSGWKDTVDVRPYETVDVLARFDGYPGRYMLHCHNLEHEDMAMMANFRVE